METYQNLNIDELNLENSRLHIFESGTVFPASVRERSEGQIGRWIYQLISWVLFDGGDLVRRVSPGERPLERWEYENLEARNTARGINRIF